MTDKPIQHDPNCAIVRQGDIRAWCDCMKGMVAVGLERGQNQSSDVLKKNQTENGN